MWIHHRIYVQIDLALIITNYKNRHQKKAFPDLLALVYQTFFEIA